MRVLAINPGSTTTKIAVYDEEEPVLVKSINHSADDLKQFANVADQYNFRKQLIKDTLAEARLPLSFDAIIGRGSLAKPVQSGVFVVNQQMVDDARNAKHQHACDLGCILAYDLASEIGCPSYTADPGVVDELNDYARISGSPIMPRLSIWHALNQKAVARKFALKTGAQYEELNLIIAHLGGGISVAAHNHGRAVDVNNCLDGEGPFSPERTGTLPASSLIDLCYSGKYTKEQLLKRIAGKAGLTAHLGTNDLREVERRIEAGDEHARLVFEAMNYHISKAICAQAAVLCGLVDAIILTGGMANSEAVVEQVRNRVEFLAPVYVFPGENEMESLAGNALAVLHGIVEPMQY